MKVSRTLYILTGMAAMAAVAYPWPGEGGMSAFLAVCCIAAANIFDHNGY